jgi:tetratricopeptide (TPR) repeat protein
MVPAFLAAALLGLWPAAAPMAAPTRSDLVAAAVASGRPPECMPPGASDKATRTSIWLQARHPNLRRYCHLLSRAHARIETAPASAAKAAKQADALLKGRAAPKVVMARAALKQGKLDEAIAMFEQALKHDARAVEQPLAMHDLAMARARAGQLESALETYRVLVPRAALLPSRTRRARVLLEAAHVAMAVGETQPGQTARTLEEALAYLREAARDPHQAHRLDISLSLVLALDRAGHPAQADAVLAEQRGTEQWARMAKGGYLAHKLDLHALRALALARSKRSEAARLWQSYLATAKGPYRAAAETRAARLTSVKKKRRRRTR